jgi:xanthine dehydrogenase accessory factor
MVKDKLILVKGAGDFASGTIRRLHLAGAKVVCTELQKPLTIRRKVAFSEAIYEGEQTIDDITAVHTTPDNIDEILASSKIPIIEDPETNILNQRKFDIVIDARMVKRNIGTRISEAPIVVGLGPGFSAGADCHAVVETLAGHNLGRVIYSGTPAPDTGIPVPTDLSLSQPQGSCCAGFEPCSSGFDVNTLVLRSPGDGVFRSEKSIGDIVKTGDMIGKVNDENVVATTDGVLRGLIHDGVQVSNNLKIGDIDPSGEVARVHQISEKANAIAGGVLEACLFLLNRGTKED